MYDFGRFRKDGFEFRDAVLRPGLGDFNQVVRDGDAQTVLLGRVFPPATPEVQPRLDPVLEASKRFLGFTHPGILNLHACGTVFWRADRTSRIYLVTDDYDPDQLLSATVSDQPMDPGQAVAGILSAAQTLAFLASQGQFHGSVGTESLLWGEQGRCRLLNPIEARLEAEFSALFTRGTSNWDFTFVAPEMIQQTCAGDPISDLFSLTAVLYYLVTGRKPFTANTVFGLDDALLTSVKPHDPRQLNPAVDQRLAAVLACGLSVDRAHRYASPGHLAEDLEAVAAGRIPPHALGRLGTPPTWAGPGSLRSSVVAGMAAVVANSSSASSSGQLPIAGARAADSQRRRRASSGPKPAVKSHRDTETWDDSERRRRRALPIILILCGLVVLGAGMGLAFAAGRSSSRPATTTETAPRRERVWTATEPVRPPAENPSGRRPVEPPPPLPSVPPPETTTAKVATNEPPPPPPDVPVPPPVAKTVPIVVHLTVDDEFITWMDGRELGRHSGGWQTCSALPLDLAPGRHVLAVMGTDRGGERMLLTDLRSPTASLVSGPAWRCASKEHERWTASDFDHKSWAPAMVLTGPAVLAQIAQISGLPAQTAAKPIWHPQVKIGTVYFRLAFDLAADGLLSAVESTPPSTAIDKPPVATQTATSATPPADPALLRAFLDGLAQKPLITALEDGVRLPPPHGPQIGILQASLSRLIADLASNSRLLLRGRPELPAPGGQMRVVGIASGTIMCELPNSTATVQIPVGRLTLAQFDALIGPPQAAELDAATGNGDAGSLRALAGHDPGIRGHEKAIAVFLWMQGLKAQAAGK